jgi:hypothetical protein
MSSRGSGSSGKASCGRGLHAAAAGVLTNPSGFLNGAWSAPNPPFPPVMAASPTLGDLGVATGHDAPAPAYMLTALDQTAQGLLELPAVATA